MPRGDSVRGLDVGCGASCVYPLLGWAEYGWSFVGSDVSERSLALAQQIVDRAGVAAGVQLRRQHDPARVLRGVLRDEHFAFTLCNPPFHASAEAVDAASARKWRGLDKRGGGGGSSRRSFGGEASELWCKPAKYPAGETSPRSRPIAATSPTSSYTLRAESDSQPHVHFTDRGFHRLADGAEEKACAPRSAADCVQPAHTVSGTPSAVRSVRWASLSARKVSLRQL